MKGGNREREVYLVITNSFFEILHPKGTLNDIIVKILATINTTMSKKNLMAAEDRGLNILGNADSMVYPTSKQPYETLHPCPDVDQSKNGKSLGY